MRRFAGRAAEPYNLQSFRAAPAPSAGPPTPNQGNNTMASEQTGSAPEITGRMYLYEQPELLSREAHAGLGLKHLPRPFDFAAGVRAIPLTVAEIPTAQHAYPVIFSDGDNATPLAVLSVLDRDNLFVGDDGRWQEGVYIPAYLRCYPFAFARRDDENYAVVVDRAAPMVSAEPDVPFFDGTELTPSVNELMQLCQRYDAEKRRTAEFSAQLKELGLLSGQQATHNDSDGKEQTIASYVACNAEKLAALPDHELKALTVNGFLAAIFAHLFSLHNWQALVEKARRQ